MVRRVTVFAAATQGIMYVEMAPQDLGRDTTASAQATLSFAPESHSMYWYIDSDASIKDEPCAVS